MTTRKLSFYTLHFSLILLLSACNGLQVATDYDKKVDFSKFHTFEFFGWKQSSENEIDATSQALIEKTITDEFTNLGYTKVVGGADLVVSLFLVFNDKTSYSKDYNSHYYGSAYSYDPTWGWNQGYYNTQFHQYEYLEGTLVVDVFDTKTKKLVWQAAGSKTVDDVNTEPSERRIKAIIGKIMSEFPKHSQPKTTTTE